VHYQDEASGVVVKYVTYRKRKKAQEEGETAGTVVRDREVGSKKKKEEEVQAEHLEKDICERGKEKDIYEKGKEKLEEVESKRRVKEVERM
jgi:hypothetical protein